MSRSLEMKLLLKGFTLVKRGCLYINKQVLPVILEKHKPGGFKPLNNVFFGDYTQRDNALYTMLEDHNIIEIN